MTCIESHLQDRVRETSVLDPWDHGAQLNIALPSPALDTMDYLSAKRISTMMGEFKGGKHWYKRSMWEISGRCH